MRLLLTLGSLSPPARSLAVTVPSRVFGSAACALLLLLCVIFIFLPRRV